MLRFMLDRLEGLKVDRLVVATSDRAEDDRVEAVAQGAGVACVRGPEDDVLARFALALRSNPADAVLRLTADCPLIDPGVVNQLMAHFRETGADYASNTLARTFPVGLDAEVMTAGALEAADREAVDPVEREHVTPFIYRRPGRFRLAALRQDRLLARERWTVDTPADLDHVRDVVARLGGGPIRVGRRSSMSWANRRRRRRRRCSSSAPVTSRTSWPWRFGIPSESDWRRIRACCARCWNGRSTTPASGPGSS